MISRRELESFEALSFDCYGTLIDWESGILAALRPVLSAHGARAGDEELLELYAAAEAAAERPPFKPYRAVLREVVVRLGQALGFAPSAAECESLPGSLARWEPFADTVAALRALKRRYKLCVVSNVDAELFAASAAKLGVELDGLVTADAVRAYKPAPDHFLRALDLLCLPANKLLHLAQSLRHDIVPARVLGLRSVWVTRRKGKTASGDSGALRASPDLEVPDLASFVALLG